MSANMRLRAPALKTAIPAFSLLVLMVIATEDSAWARTRQQCSEQYARCLNRALDTGKGEKTWVNCDKVANNCFRNASDPVKKTTIQTRKSYQTTTLSGKVNALEPGKYPIVNGGSLKRR